MRVITGRPGAGTSLAIDDEVRQALSAGMSACLLVPTLPDVRRAQSRLAGDLPVGLQVAQLDRFIETEWTLRGDGRRLVDRLERRILLSRAWDATSGGAALRSGLHDLLATLVRLAAAHGVEHARAVPTGPAGRVVHVLERYFGDLAAAGLIEPGSAAHALSRTPCSPAGLVAVSGFTDLDPAQCAVLATWSVRSDVVIAVPYDVGVPATEVIRTVVDRLASMGATLQPLEPREAIPPELDALARRLFGPGTPVRAEGRIELGLVQGAEAEARFLARRVSRAVAAGIPAERIAVAFRDPTRHYPWLSRALGDEGVGADYDVSLPVGETPFGRALLQLWAFATGGHRRVDLAGFLRTPFSGVSPSAVDAADGRWRWHRRADGLRLLGDLRSGDGGERLITDMVRAAGEPLNAASAATWQEMADCLLANAYPGDAPILDGAALVDAAAHRALVSAIDTLVELGDALPIHLMDAYRASRVSQAVLERPGNIQVLSVDRLRSRQFDVVLIGGLTAGEFPRRGAGDVLEGDAVREVLDAFGVTHDQSEESARERLLFYLAATRARETLVLVRQEADEEGRGLRRSIFWDEVLDLYRPAGSDDDTGCPVSDELVIRSLAEEEGRVARSRTPRGCIADDRVRSRLAAVDVVSASDIEAYLSCPYAWFVERVLRPGRLDLEIDPRVRGALVHDALARFYLAWPCETGNARVGPASVSGALALADRIVSEVLADAPEARTLDEEQTLGSVRSQAARLVERDASFLPAYAPVAVEWSFGMDDDPLDLGTFRLKGRADRIDEGPEGIVVIDYKGSSATKLSDLEKYGKIQLQLYAIAAAAAFGRPVAGGLYRALSTTQDRGFFLQGIDGPGLTRTDALDAAGIEELLRSAVDTAARAVEGMRAAAIEPAPDPRRCAFCTASGFCDEVRQ
ncbi:MAG: PD-(D/E)XK nuclease family protein [Coriobacteriia bacterium]|nr:PD-(D/E)XK nuclease family protein [Coriobacteriia bacterium]